MAVEFLDNTGVYVKTLPVPSAAHKIVSLCRSWANQASSAPVSLFVRFIKQEILRINIRIEFS